MRGCLTFVLFAAVVIGALGWFGLPALASAGISVALAAGGFSGTDTAVAVTADPPFELVGLHADRVHVQSTRVRWQDVTAATLDMTLTDVALGARTFAGLGGRLTGVTVGTGTQALSSGLVTLAGSSRNATATLSVSAATVRGLALDAAAAAIGQRPSAVRLAPPNTASFSVGGRTAEGRLAIDAGGALVALVQGVGSVTLVPAPAGGPFRLTSVAVTADGGLSVVARLDLGPLSGDASG